MIEVRLFGTLRQGREKIQFFAPETHGDIASILDALGLSAHDVGLQLVNGFTQKPQDPVKDGDLVSLFPAAPGGG